jgi:hemerythrin-like domain-containing protein
MHKAVKDMKVIELEKIEEFLDQQIRMEKEHRRMRRALRILRKRLDWKSLDPIPFSVDDANKLIDKALERVK